MRLRGALLQAARLLTAIAHEEAPLEAEVLMRHLLGLDRTGLFLQSERELGPAEEEAFQGLVERRLQGEPVAYIVGHKEFFGLDLYVDRRVLIPRPETELLVEKALELLRDHPRPLIADVGTGSGAIALALAKNLPQAIIYAIDISQEALEVAAINRHLHDVAQRVRLLQGNLLEPLPEPVDLIVANLPYVRRDDLRAAGPRLSCEPGLALEGGEGGLETIRRLLEQVPGKLRKGGRILLEIGLGQREALEEMATRLLPGARLEFFRDLRQIERAALIGLRDAD